MDEDAPENDETPPLLLTPAMRVGEPKAAAPQGRRAERLAELQAIVGPMKPLEGSAFAAPAAQRPAALRAPAPAPAGPAPLDAALRETLRALVAEELSGPLGEQITARLRRLVREEVEFALSRRELD